MSETPNEEQLAEIEAHTKAAHRHICEIAKTGTKAWRMTIPVQPDDSDIMLGDVCRNVQFFIDATRQLQQQLAAQGERVRE